MIDLTQVKRDALIGEAEAKKESTIGDLSSQIVILVFMEVFYGGRIIGNKM